MLELQRLQCSAITTAQNLLFGGIKAVAKSLLAFQRTRPQQSPLENLFRLTEQMINQQIPKEDKQRMLQRALLKCDMDTRNSLYGRVYELAQDVNKGIDPSWGEHHAADDHGRLALAIRDVAEAKLRQLSDQKRSQVYGKIYELAGCPSTIDLRWGENHARENTARLISAIDSISTPPSALHQKKTYFRGFEEALSSQSSIYHLGRKELPGKQIGYINGMKCSFEHARLDAEKISNHVGQGYNIHGVHSATHGLPLDYAEALLGQSGISTKPVALLHQVWHRFFQDNPDSQYLQICHSKGAIHVKNALETFDDALRKRIIVVAIAPAAFIPKGLCSKSHHCLIKKDPVPFFALNSDRIFNPDDEICILPEHADGSHPHDLHGISYTQKMFEIINQYRSMSFS